MTKVVKIINCENIHVIQTEDTIYVLSTLDPDYEFILSNIKTNG